MIEGVLLQLGNYIDYWKNALDKCTFYKIKCEYERLREEDFDIDLLHCSLLDDKIEIIKKIESFKDICLMCERDEGDVKYLLKKLKRLRNNLAHSNHLRTKFRNWNELLETVKICRVFTEEMRKELQ